jgi:hypothetical protein
VCHPPAAALRQRRAAPTSATMRRSRTARARTRTADALTVSTARTGFGGEAGSKLNPVQQGEGCVTKRAARFLTPSELVRKGWVPPPPPGWVGGFGRRRHPRGRWGWVGGVRRGCGAALALSSLLSSLRQHRRFAHARAHWSR